MLIAIVPGKERDYNAYSKDYMSSILKQSCTNTRSCFRDGDILFVPEDHINDSDQSSTLAGCSACCDHATTSENTEDQESRSWSHANMHHANVVLSFQIRPCCIDQYIQVS
uniref:Uncharacterized protein n=1 Tax=Oryza nivara TaxID=4536 RepID=A0A0E0ISN8_ORYNI